MKCCIYTRISALFELNIAIDEEPEEHPFIQLSLCVLYSVIIIVINVDFFQCHYQYQHREEIKERQGMWMLVCTTNTHIFYQHPHIFYAPLLPTSRAANVQCKGRGPEKKRKQSGLLPTPSPPRVWSFLQKKS